MSSLSCCIFCHCLHKVFIFVFPYTADCGCKRPVQETWRKRAAGEPFFPGWAAAHHPSSRSLRTPGDGQQATGRNRCKSYIAQLQVEAERVIISCCVLLCCLSPFFFFFNSSLLSLLSLQGWCFTGSMKTCQMKILKRWSFCWVTGWADDQLRCAK